MTDYTLDQATGQAFNTIDFGADNDGAQLEGENTPDPHQTDQNTPEDSPAPTTGKDKPSPAKTEEKKEQQKNQRDQLTDLILNMGSKLFHDSSERTYISVPVAEHIENMPLRSATIRRLLQHSWHKLTGSGISGSVISEVIDLLDANARFTGAEETVYIRIANTTDAIYVDLCDSTWKAVRITADGWDIISDPPVKFIRTKGMLPLPEPRKAGDINKLRRHINAKEDEIWIPTVAWLLAAFSSGPYPVLVLLGEQGSAKSFASRVLLELTQA